MDDTICMPRGACRRDRLTKRSRPLEVVLRLLTLFDDYRIAVNPIPEYAKVH